LDVSSAKPFLLKKLSGKFSTALDMGERVLGPRASYIIAFLEIAGIVKKDGGQGELEHALIKPGLRVSQMTPPQQAGQAKNALECMLKIMVPGIYRLIIPVFAAKTINSPIKKASHKRQVSMGKDYEIGSFDLSLYGGWIAGDNRRIHLISG